MRRDGGKEVSRQDRDILLVAPEQAWPGQVQLPLCLQAPGGDNAGECLATGATHQSTDNPSYILYNPQSNRLSDDFPFPLLASTWPFNLYPFLALLPGTGSILVVSGNKVAVFVINGGGWLPDTDWGLPVSLPIPVLYPMTAAITLLPLSAADSWQAQVRSHSITGSSHSSRLTPGQYRHPMKTQQPKNVKDAAC